MVTIKIICVGTLKEKFLKEAFLEYQKRLVPFCNLKIEELSESRVSARPTEIEISLALEDEGEKILSKLGKSEYMVALCIEGKNLSSSDFSKYVENIMLNGSSTITFVIGGSFGLAQKVKARAELKLSFSKMTFTHQFSRVILMEQIYRVFQILSGGKYHK